MGITDSAAGFGVVVVSLLLIAVVSETSEFLVEAILNGALAAAPELVKVAAVDNWSDLSCFHVEIDGIVFFLLAVVSLVLLLRACLRLSVWMF